MYVANDNRANFFVRHYKWRPYVYGLVQVVCGKESGILPGEPPYHNNMQVSGELYYGYNLVNPDYIFVIPGHGRQTWDFIATKDDFDFAIYCPYPDKIITMEQEVIASIHDRHLKLGQL